MMWILIMLAMVLAAAAMFGYVVSRFCRFGWIRQLAGEKRSRRILLAMVPVLLIAVVLVITMNTINMIIVFIHLGLIWMLCDLLVWLLGKKVRMPKRFYAAGTMAIIVTVVYLSAGWYLAHHVWEKDYRIETDKSVGTLRVVQFADSHVGATFHGKGFAEKLAEIQELHPDVLVITGDYVDDDTTKEDMLSSCAALGELETTYGVYYAFGNHDKGYYGDEFRGYSGDDLIQELEKNKVTVLQDEAVLIDDRFYIIGRQDRSEEQRGSSRASMEELTKELDPEKFSIVLDHQPHDYDAEEKAGVDLVLSGHTHGGQFFPINYVGEWTGENAKTYGLEKRSDTNFIVTSGISDWAIKFKTGCRSEYVVIDIEGK